MTIEAGKILLAGIMIFGGAFAASPTLAFDAAEQRPVVVNEDGRFEYPLDGAPVAKDSIEPDAGQPHCSYLPGAAGATARTFRFADGNEAVFSADRVQFTARDGTRTQIDDGTEVTGKSWWCQADSVVLFRTLKSPGGGLGALKVELFSSKGEPVTVTMVQVPPHGADVSWSYVRSRLLDECLGMTFRVVRQEEQRADALQTRFVEYRLCPKGI